MKKLLLFITIVFITNSVSGQAVFQGRTYTPSQPDYSILQRSLNQIEQRSNQASNAYSELCHLIGEKYQEIHSDRESLIWFDKNIRSLSKEVQDLMNMGCYGDANRLAMQYIGKINSDSELAARIRTNKEYVNIRNYVMQRNDLSVTAKKMWDEKYKYVFVPMLSSSGEVIGGYDWMDVGGPGKTRVILP